MRNRTNDLSGRSEMKQMRVNNPTAKPAVIKDDENGNLPEIPGSSLDAADKPIGLARHLAGYIGPEFDSLPRDKTQLQEWKRVGGAGQIDHTQDDLLEIAQAAISYLSATTENPSVVRFDDVPHASVYIREEREARGWSEAELAVRMGEDTQENLLCVHLYEHVGPTDVNLKMGDDLAYQLAVAFQVTPTYFLALEKVWQRAQAWKAGSA
jgi:hypothetical protein